MKTLYVSDLDGTLLNSQENISEYTYTTINELVNQGMIFSYATARSLHTSKKVTKGLDAKIPLIVYNGTFVIDNVTNDILIAHYFEESVHNVLNHLIENDIYPIVYSYINNEEKFSYIKEKCSKETISFLNTRQGDIRERSVSTIKELTEGHCFYITCIDQPEKLEPFYHQYKDQYHCLYQKDIYTNDQWLEIMPKNVSKSNAIKQLKSLLQCDHLIVFGDGLNDLDMFDIADECYAVDNAVDELKEKATAIIDNHNTDAVAKWLKSHYHKGRK